MASFIYLQIAVAAALSAPQGTQLTQGSGIGGMPPCKRCGVSRGHSRDQLLAMDDGDLVKMKDSLSTEVEALSKEVGALKEKNGAELGKMDKTLTALNDAYKKSGEEEVERTAKFSAQKAAASKALGEALTSQEDDLSKINDMHGDMDEMRSYLNPLVDKLVSGKGWPKSCKCPKAAALLQHLQAVLRLASVNTGVAEPSRQGAALLRRSSKLSAAPPPEKYRLVHEVQELEDKRNKLMEEKSDSITGFSTQQRIQLDRINAAKIRNNLQSNSALKYKESDASLEKVLKKQMDAASDYLDSSDSQLERLDHQEHEAMQMFKAFKAELAKCKCL